LLAIAVLLVATAVGVAAASAGNLSVGVALLAGPGLVAFGFLVIQGPEWCLLGLIAAVVLGFSNDSAQLGSIDIRVPDVFLVALACWVVVVRARHGQRGWIAGRRLFALWLLALGFSIYPLLVQGTTDVGSLIGWIRLVATFGLVWFVPYALFQRRDVEFLLGGIALITTAEIVIAIVGSGVSGFGGSRLAGGNGPNTTGLIAAIVIVLALHGPVPRRRALRLGMLAIGVLGLLLSRSLGSTTAAVVAVGIYGIISVDARRTDNPRSQLIVPLRLLLMVVVGLTVAFALRPGNLPLSSQFGKSTTAHRGVLAYGGLELFRQEPVFGIGWQRAPEEIGSPEVNAALRARFGDAVNPLFIPEEGRTTEIHNSYVQVLAEAGLVGFFLMVAVMITMGRGIRRILQSLRWNRALYVSARCAVVGIVVVLVWWNDNTLYGAQPETVLCATFLGLLATMPLIARADREQQSVDVT
jgi:O-antigen ligase